MKNVLLLGATGSIGKSVLSVISQNKESLNLIGISFNKNVSRYQEILEKHSPEYVYIEDHDSFKSLCSKDKERYLNGDEELERLINRDDVDIIVCATSGFAGLKTAYIASTTGKKILLANKESIVAGGDLILPLAKENNTKIIPIDSEHNAIFQCLSGEKGTEDVKSITITASGGPFINAPIQDLQHVTVEDALKHPNWKMGSKVTIDSATLVNKCLELIEARYLFDLDENGYGRAVYSFSKKNRTYSLVCFANKINDEERSDRVIATKWDAAFVLHDGIPSKKDIERLELNVPKQEVGRLSYKELTLSRANKSVRAFEHVVDSLSNGRQPDKEFLSKVGYLYRTTAVLCAQYLDLWFD